MGRFRYRLFLPSMRVRMMAIGILNSCAASIRKRWRSSITRRKAKPVMFPQLSEPKWKAMQLGNGGHGSSALNFWREHGFKTDNRTGRGPGGYRLHSNCRRDPRCHLRHEMIVVKRRVSNILVFRPDGGGTISDSLVSISPTWRAAPGGICIKPRPGDAEKCLQLTRTKAGIEASQNGKTVWVLKR